MSPEAAVHEGLQRSLSLAMTEDYQGSAAALLKAGELASAGGIVSIWKDPEVADFVCDHCSKLATTLFDENDDATAFRILTWQAGLYPNDYYLHANLGRYYSRAEVFEQAITHLKVAVSEAPRQSIPPAYAMRAYQSLAGASYQLDRKDEARECLREALRTIRWPIECRQYLEQMLAQLQRDDLIIVSNAHKHGERPMSAEQSEKELLGGLFARASEYLRQGKLASAKEAFEKVLAGAKLLNEGALQAECVHELAGVAMESGRLEEAANLYEQAAEMLIELDGPQAAVPALYNAFGALHALQQHQKAEVVAAELVELTSGNSDIPVAWRIGCLLRLLIYRPKDAAVVAQLNGLLDQYMSGVNVDTATFADAELLLQVHSAFPIGPQSERLCRMAGEIFRKEGSVAWERRARQALAECLYAQGRLQGAHDTALALFNDVRYSSPFDTLRTSELLADISEQQFGASLAAKHLETAIEYGEQTRSIISDAQARAQFFASLDSIYRRLVSTYVVDGRWEEALTLAERTNARVLAEHLANVADELPATPSADLVDEYRRWRGQMDRVWSHVLQGRINVATFHEQRRQIEPALDRAQQQLMAADPRNAQQVTGFPPDWRQERDSIPQDRAYLFPFTVADGWILFVVRNGKIVAQRVQSSPEEMRTSVRRFWEWIRLPDADDFNRDLGKAPPVAADLDQGDPRFLAGQLHHDLIAPVAEHLRDIRELVWIPDYTWVDLPVAALHDGTQYLVEQFAISCGVTVGMDLASRGRLAVQRSLPALLIGNPDGTLPHAEREVQDLAGSLKSATVLIGKAATFEAIQASIKRAGLVHFACHSVHDEENPFNSFLRLADRDDGMIDRLTARDIYLEPWQASLLVFSSCQSGRGRSAIGNEREGLVRAALHGGVTAVVAALWPVGDESTRLLMSQFYMLLAEHDVATALAKAQRTLLRDAPTSHPSHWAAFQMFGTSVDVQA